MKHRPLGGWAGFSYFLLQKSYFLIASTGSRVAARFAGQRANTRHSNNASAEVMAKSSMFMVTGRGVDEIDIAGERYGCIDFLYPAQAPAQYVAE